MKIQPQGPFSSASNPPPPSSGDPRTSSHEPGNSSPLKSIQACQKEKNSERGSKQGGTLKSNESHHLPCKMNTKASSQAPTELPSFSSLEKKGLHGAKGRTGAWSDCELQGSFVVVAGCGCCECGCGFARAAVWFVLGLRICVGVSRRLREPTCGVAFTGAVDVVARAKQMLVCRVAPLVERCDTCLLLLPALCWLVANSGEVLSESFSVGSGGELFVVLVRVPLPLGLLLFPELLVVVLVMFTLRTNGALVVLVEVLPEPVVLLSLASMFSLLAVCWPFGWAASGDVFQIGSWRFGWSHGAGQVVFLFIFEFLDCAGGTLCVPMVRWLALFLAPCVLSQMVVWRVSWVFGWLCLLSLPLCGLVVELVTPLVRVVSLWYDSAPCVQCEAAPGILRFGLLVQASFRCVFLLCLSCALEALVTVGRVALPHLWCVGGVELSTSGTPCADRCLVAIPLPLWGGFFALPSFLWLHSRCVSWSDHEDDLGDPKETVVWPCRSCVLYLAFGRQTFLVGLVRAVPMELSTSACVLCAIVVCSTNLSGCRGAQVGCVLVAVWAAIAIRLALRRPAPSCSGSRRLNALAGSPFPFLPLFLLFLLSEEGSLLPSFSGGGSLAEQRRLMRSVGTSARRRQSCIVKAPLSVVVATPGCSIPMVRLPADVATAERVATSEKASPRSDVTLSWCCWPSR
ncbi:hypothetical protein Taro_030851 [Colocasia esculenta]|uniref:Transmembrane protein n=1 Tax=Colocasia esculenta TaxID=4460 RepID=A0A843VV45_COLES|nr:hypothetical protein [Colocasia esculenta]